MNRRSFLKTAVGTATAAVPLSAFIARAQDPSHEGGLRRGQTSHSRSPGRGGAALSSTWRADGWRL